MSVQRRINPGLGKDIALGMAAANAREMWQLRRQEVRGSVVLSARIGNQSLRQRDCHIGPNAVRILVAVRRE